MVNTTTPPPKTGGSRSFVVAALVMLLLMGGLIVWKVGGEDPPPEPPREPAPPAAATPAIDAIVPPPPPITSEDAGTAPAPTKKAGPTGGTYCSTCGKCRGTAPGNLASALRSRAGTAQRCYEKALAQQEGLEGKLTLNLCVGVGGQVCSASVGSDSLRSPLVSQCVLNIFRSSTFPSPKNGCVEAQVPLNFVPQKR